MLKEKHHLALHLVVLSDYFFCYWFNGFKILSDSRCIKNMRSGHETLGKQRQTSLQREVQASYGYIVGTCFKNIRQMNRSFISHISIAKCKPTLFKSPPKRPKLIFQAVMTETFVNFIKYCYWFIGERLFKGKLEFYKKGEWIFGLRKTSRSHLIMSDFPGLNQAIQVQRS